MTQVRQRAGGSAHVEKQTCKMVTYQRRIHVAAPALPLCLGKALGPMSNQKSSFRRERRSKVKVGVWCREKALRVRVILCSEGQVRCKAGASIQMGRSHLPPHQVAPDPKALLGAGVCFLWSSSLASSEESCSGVCGHVCTCDTREWLAGASTLVGNKLWMGR